MLKAVLVGAFAFSVLLVFAVRGINRRNAAFQEELNAPKGHISPAFLEIALDQVETHLQDARAGSNVRFEMADKSVFTVLRQRDRKGAAGYLLRWEDRSNGRSVLERLRAAASSASLQIETPSEIKLEITFPDDYLLLESFIEETIGQLDHDDLQTVLTWTCKSRQSEKESAT